MSKIIIDKFVLNIAPVKEIDGKYYIEKEYLDAIVDQAPEYTDPTNPADVPFGIKKLCYYLSMANAHAYWTRDQLFRLLGRETINKYFTMITHDEAQEIIEENRKVHKA